ncbi:ATP-binding protein [Streptomyces sp. TRM 70351]|uniref:ATP-binding protein n=1 Tax=Streptomyces sp. TRM 70351 TaxID=3116552 RepID=UPI002E7C42DF|nr:ATP-binding protein [Streptomyces sp. TRM 70351]MEE1928460.1 ATP-binding protein [Streptomyces sp. TRM 70351]
MLKRPVERRKRQESRRRPAGAWWGTAAAVALVCGAAAALLPAPTAARALAAGLAVLVVLAASWALRSRGRAADAEARRREAQATADARAAELAHLAGVRLPAIAERVRAGRRLDGVPGPVASPDQTGDGFARDVAAIAEGLGSDEAVRRERALRDSVQAAFESVARTMHAMATVQQQVLDHVEQLLTDPRLMSEVMKADHAAAQMTRKAQTLLVMCGIWPARREVRPVTLYDCVRGAQSRIVEFGRVDVHGGQTLYVVPPAVEGVMHAVAELLENATVFSPSRTQVVVTLREVGAGAVIEIDDAGLGMPPDVLDQAVGRLRDDLDLAQLGAVPRLGLACVGRWARELGFNVELSGASAYGGTRAVVFVPHRLLTEPLPGLTEDTGAHALPQQAPGYGQDAAGFAVPPSAPGHAPAHAAPAPAVQHQAQHHTQDHAAQDHPARTRSGHAGPRHAAPRAAERYPAPHQPPHPAAQDGPYRAAQDAPQDASEHPALPRRRSRRRETGPGAPQGGPQQRPAPLAPPRPDGGRPAPDWSPEAARASVASVVSGSRRGRAAAQDTEQTDDHDGARP